MTSTLSFDVVFVGNGILALSSAFELKRRDPSLSIAIIGPDARDGAATKAAGAMLNCFAEVTKYTMRSAAARAKFAMCRRSLSMWPTWLDAINERHTDAPLRSRQGTVVIENAVSGELDTDNFDAILEAAAGFDAKCEIIEPRSITGLAPAPPARPLRALLLPNEGAIDSGDVYQTLHAVLAGLGVEFIAAPAQKLSRSGERVIGAVLSNDVSVHGSAVVVAAGAFTTPLLDSVVAPDEVQPVFSGTGIAMVTERHSAPEFDHVIRSVNRAGSCGLHAIPMTDGCDYVGATNDVFATPMVRASTSLSHFLIQCAIDQLSRTFADAEIVEWRVGNRPVSLDTFPLIGAGPRDGLYITTGTYRDGFHNGPLIAKIVADDILGSAEPYAHPFSPCRRPISVMSAVDSTNETAYHETCSGFEASLILPRFWSWHHDLLPNLFKPGVQQMYDDLQVESGLSPDIVPFLLAGFSEQKTASHPIGPDTWPLRRGDSGRNTYLRVKSLLRNRSMSTDLDDCNC